MDMSDLEERMERIEAELAEIKTALLGDLRGENSLLARVRANEERSKENERRSKENEEWRQRVMWMLAGAAAAGGLSGGGLVAVLMRLFGG